MPDKYNVKKVLPYERKTRMVNITEEMYQKIVSTKGETGLTMGRIVDRALHFAFERMVIDGEERIK